MLQTIYHNIKKTENFISTTYSMLSFVRVSCLRGGKQVEQTLGKLEYLVTAQLALPVHAVHEGDGNLTCRQSEEGIIKR